MRLYMNSEDEVHIAPGIPVTEEEPGVFFIGERNGSLTPPSKNNNGGGRAPKTRDAILEVMQEGEIYSCSDIKGVLEDEGFTKSAIEAAFYRAVETGHLTKIGKGLYKKGDTNE